MSFWKSLTSSSPKSQTTPIEGGDDAGAPPDADAIAEAKKTEKTAKVAEPAAQIVEDDPPPALDKKQGGLQAQTVAEQANRRGNFAAIMSAQKAGEVPEDSIASVAALTRGKAFGPKKADTIQKVMGQPVTREGLEQLYGSVLPDANVFVTNVGQDRYSGALEFTVNWMDNEGATVAKLSRRMARHKDGDLELYSHGCWVDASHRSRAVSAAVMQRETELLENLSDHPRTRLSLWAGGMKDPKNPKDFQPLGVYVWATMGFDCAQSHGNRSQLSKSGRRARCDLEHENKGLREKADFDLMKLMFDVWVDNAAERGQIPDDPAVVRDLKRAADMCPNMWSLATLQVPGLDVGVDVGGRKSQVHVGKAFLLSEEAPRWEGVFYVNNNPEDFKAVADAYCQPRVGKAQAAFDDLQVQLAEALDGDDLDAKHDALRQVGRSGDARWIEALEGLIEAEPELADAAQAALRCVNGERLTEALAEQAEDPGRPVKARLSSLDLCIERDPERRLPLLTSLVEAPGTGSDFEVARAALNRLARGAIEPEALLDTLTGLYDHALHAREKMDRADRGGYARGKSFFSQKVDTREAVVGHLGKLKLDGATDALLDVVKKDPYWEVAGAALDVWATRVADDKPDEALAQVQSFLTRTRDRHAELKREKAGADKDRAYKVGDLMNRVSRVRNRAIETLAKLHGPGVADALEDSMRAEPYWDGVATALEGLAAVIGEEDPSRVVDKAEYWARQAENYAPMRARCVDVLAELANPDARRAMVKLAAREQDRQVLRALSGGLAGARVAGAAEARETVDGRLEAIRAQEEARWAAQRQRR